MLAINPADVNPADVNPADANPADANPADEVFRNRYLSSRILMYAMPEKTRGAAAAHGLIDVLECNWGELEDDGQDLTLLAATNNHVRVLLWLCARKSLHITDDTFEAAIAAGSLEAVQFLSAHAQFGTRYCIANHAAFEGSLRILQVYAPCTSMGLVLAAVHDHQACFEWLLEGDGRVVLDKGDDPIEWYMENTLDPQQDIIFALATRFPHHVHEGNAHDAAMRGLVPGLEALYGVCPDTFTGSLYKTALEAEDGEVLAWLLDKDIAPPRNLVTECIATGDVPALQLLLDHSLIDDARINEYGTYAAAQHKYFMCSMLLSLVKTSTLKQWGVPYVKHTNKRQKRTQ